jgi:hypothetical protein
MTKLIPLDHGALVNYEPHHGLRKIAGAEAGERYWARAKDPTRLYEAILVKITEQAKFIVWHDGLRKLGRPQKNGPGTATIFSSNEVPDKRVLHRWRAKFCVKQDGHTIIDEAKIRLLAEDIKHRVARICEQEKTSTIRGTEGTGEFERYTPAAYVEAAREVLGSIDLDPASNPIAQQIVRAARYFTVVEDGLQQEWRGRIFLNPPYHRELMPQFIDKLIVELDAGHTQAAILLTNNCSDTRWFQRAAKLCEAVCFTHGRIHFTQPNGIEVLPTQGQAFFYFGTDGVQRFKMIFGPPKKQDEEKTGIGVCMRPL